MSFGNSHNKLPFTHMCKIVDTKYANVVSKLFISSILILTNYLNKPSLINTKLHLCCKAYSKM